MTSEIRRDLAIAAWNLDRGAVLVASGLPVPIPGTDQSHEFHAHNEFAYLSGIELDAATLAFDPREGWTLFAPVASQEDRVWSGDSESLESLAERTGIDRVRPSTALESWLEQRRGETVALLGNHDFEQRTPHYGVMNLPALELTFDRPLAAELSDRISEQRRAKDGDELRRMRAASAASAGGHLLAMNLARPGMTERQLQVEMEAEFFRHGAKRTAYGSIVGTGSNGSVLHFSPTSRELRDGDLVLIDAAAEYDSYAADITRTFPVAAAYTGIQRDLYELVLETQTTAIGKVRPGQEYRDLHLAAAHQIASGLRDLDILRGNPADLVESDAHAIFFPHGLGHMLGLATHDSGGCLAGREKSDRFGLKWLRADLPLQPGYVVTIEPGIYFIRTLLTDPAWREKYRESVSWDRIDTMLDFGGIRIEDDILVTEDGPEVLSAAIPRTIPEIEAIRRDALAGRA